MGYTLQELSTLCNAKLHGDPTFCISGINTLEDARQEDASFLANIRYTEAMKSSKAGVICVDATVLLPLDKNFLISEDPCLAFQKIAKLFFPEHSSSFTGIHPTAVIHPSAHIGPHVTIGPHVVI